MAYASLAGLLRDELPESDVKAIEQMLADPLLGPLPRSRLLFGLAHVFDARREYERAAACMGEANALRLKLAVGQRRCSPAEEEERVGRVIAAFDGGLLGRLAGQGADSRRPVFIVGLPRSGTTLVEQVLASHTQVHGAGELQLAGQSFRGIPGILGRQGSPLECAPHLTEEAVKKLSSQYLGWLEALDGGRATRIVDKMPDNYAFLGLLVTLFPRATFIHCRRDLRDVALSCWMTDFALNDWASDVEHIASRFRQYLQLMDHWQGVLETPVHTVDYEDMVNDTEATSRRLLADCGLDWEPACLEFYRTQRPIRTASAVQVRRPIYHHSVGRWRNYETALADLFSRLPSSPR
ncbi:MAG: sulfotransferase family protein [Isosphaeraceae bacterium]